MSERLAEYEYGDFVLVVTDRGFHLYDKNDKEEVLIDSSLIGSDESLWKIEISCKSNERYFYSECNTAVGVSYFNAGIGIKKNDKS